MSQKKQIWPADVEAWAHKHWARHHQSWLLEGDGPGANPWPHSLTLNTLTEKDVLQDLAGARAWIAAWRGWKREGSPGTLEWIERQWPAGRQSLPAKLTFASAADIADQVGQRDRWTRACARYRIMADQWPALAGGRTLGRHFAVLADYSELEFTRLISLLSWLEANPASGLYLRQLPIPGFDTKWAESRKGLVTDLMQVLKGMDAERDFFVLCGMRRPAPRVRMRVLCPRLRLELGGLCDIEGSIEELAGLGLRPEIVLIVENLETGLALPDFPGVVAFMRLGHSVDLLDRLPWLHGARRHVYWGDLDTHGLAILAKARRRFPATESVLMDEATLLGHKDLWVDESSQSSVERPDGLTSAELALYQGLREQRWGTKVRLEQERLDWPMAMRALEESLGAYESHQN